MLTPPLRSTLFPYTTLFRSVLEAGPRPARDDSPHAGLARGQRRAVEGSARGSGARAGANCSAARERRSGRRAIDQPRIGPTQRAAAPADGEPRRHRPRAHARSIVMQAMYLMVAAVVAMQHPVVPRVVVPPLAPVQAALEGVGALDALNAVGPWDGGSLQDEQDPTDSLWRAARRAFNRGDYTSAARHRDRKSTRLNSSHTMTSYAVFRLKKKN